MRSANHCRNSSFLYVVSAADRILLLVLAIARNGRAWLARPRFPGSRCAAVACTPTITQSLIVDQIVVVVSQPSRCAALGGVSKLGTGGRYLVLLVNWLFHRVLLLQVRQILTHRAVELCRPPSTARVEYGSPLAAFASTKLPSTDRCLPCTSPTSTHCCRRSVRTTARTVSTPETVHAVSFFENVEVMRDLLDRSPDR